MYYSEIEENIIKKIEDYFKWFLFSSSLTYKDTKSKIGLDRLYQLKSFSKFGVKNIRELWVSLKLTFLIQTMTTSNNLRNIIKNQLEEEERNSKIEGIQNHEHLTQENDFTLLYKIFEIEGIEINLKDINGLYYRIGNEKGKIISWKSNNIIVRIRKERIEIKDYSYLKIETEARTNLLLSDLADHLESIKVKGDKITLKSLQRKEELRFTKGQKKLEEMSGIKIIEEIEKLESLKLISKVKASWLAVLLNSIQIQVNMHGKDKSKKCQICKMGDGDMGHLLMKCKNAKSIIKLKQFKDIKRKSWCDTSDKDGNEKFNQKFHNLEGEM